jgi:CHAD domain-containing protein
VPARTERPRDGGSDPLPGPRIGDILVASLEERWRRFLTQLRRNRRTATEASVHDLRVSIRRLLATIDMVGTLLPDDGFRKSRRLLRKHLKSFNRLRDTHIQILALRALAREFPPVRPLGADLRRRETKLVRDARQTIASIRPEPLERSLADAAVRLGGLRLLPAFEEVATATAIGALGGAFVRAFDLRQRINPADPASIHRLRVAFKKCRYMLEVLAPLLPGADRRFLKLLNDYQTRMGEIQDLQVVTACVTSFTLDSRYAPTLSLVPVQQRLADLRKGKVDDFLAHADDLYALWASASGSSGEAAGRGSSGRPAADPDGRARAAGAPHPVRVTAGSGRARVARKAVARPPVSSPRGRRRHAGRRR